MRILIRDQVARPLLAELVGDIDILILRILSDRLVSVL